MDKQWDVLVTIDATMSGRVRGIEAPTEEVAAIKALDPRVLQSKAVYFEVNDDNFHQWIRDAYLPDPSESVEPHEPALKTPETMKTVEALDRVLTAHFGKSHIPVIDEYLECRCSNPVVTAFVDRLRGLSALHQGGTDFLAKARSEAETLAKIFAEVAESLD